MKRGDFYKMELAFAGARRAGLFTLAALALALAACAAPSEPAAPPPAPSAGIDQTMDVSPSPASTASADPAPSPTGEATQAEFSAGKLVAHVFGEGEDALLYCGFEAVNTGNCPAIIETVHAEFSVEGAGRFSEEFSPVAGEYDVVVPGEMTYCALWLPARKALPDNPSLTLSIDLTAAPSDAPKLELAVKNARIIQNYPDFATISGSLWNESGEECPLNVVYTAFYDQAGELLGVFHFTKNAGMFADEFKNFVVHMQPLPIENLADNTAAIETHAFGIE